MATPTVASAVTKSFSSATTAHLMDYPATVDSGDLLLIIFINDDTTNQTKPSGYTVLDTEAITALGFIGIYAKVADGTEDGGTEDVVTAVAQEGAGQIFRITGWGGTISTDIDIAAPVAESTTTPNPPSVTAGWGADTNLFLAIVGSADDDASASGGPASWTDLLTVSAGAGANNSPGVHTARLASSNATEDPGTFTISTSEACESFTLVIKPGVATAMMAKMMEESHLNG